MKTIFSYGLFLISAFTFAQTCDLSLTGKLIDYHNGLLLQGAEVTLNNQWKTYTDAEGKFSIQNLCPDSYRVEIQHPDCETFQLTIELNASQTVEWYMEHHIYELEAVEAKGQRAQKETGMHEEVLSKKELQTYMGTNLGTALKSLAGVDGLSTGNTLVKPVIHGLHSSRVLMLNQGVRQEDQEWGVEHAPNLDLNAFDEVSVIKGSGALRYGGDAIGGVVIAETPYAPKKDTLMGDLSLLGVTNGRGGAISASLQKGFNEHWSMRLQTSLQRFGDFEAPDYVLSNTGVFTKGVAAELNYQSFKRTLQVSYSFFDNQVGILAASHFGNLNDLQQAIASDQPLRIDDFTYEIGFPRQEISHHLAKIKGTQRIRNFGKLELQYAFQHNRRFEFDIRRGDDRGKASVDLQLTTHSAELFANIDRFQNWEIQWALNGMYQQNVANPETGVKRLIPDYEQWELGSYVGVDFKGWSRVKLSTALRMDYTHLDAKKFYDISDWNENNYDAQFGDWIIDTFPTQYLVNARFDYYNLSISSGAQYNLNPHHQLNFHYGLANRAPNPSELFSDGLHHSAAALEVGDLNISPETSNKFSLNYLGKFPKVGNAQVDITAYWNHIADFIYLVPSGAEFTIRGAFPVWRFTQVDARLWGIDVNVRKQFANTVDWQSSFAWVVADDLTNDAPLLNIPPLQWTNQLGWAFGKSKQFSLGWEGRFVARQNRFPDYNFNITVIENEQNVEKEVDISTPPDSFFIQGLHFGYDLPLEKSALNFQLRINNLLDVSNRDYLNRLRYFADDLGRNIQLQINYNF